MEINNFYESNIYFRTSVRTCRPYSTKVPSKVESTKVPSYTCTGTKVQCTCTTVHTAVHGFSIKESLENVNKNGTFGLRPTRPTRPLR